MCVYFRVANVYKNAKINVKKNSEIVMSKKKVKLAPGEMESIIIKKDLLDGAQVLEFSLEV